MRLMLKEIEKKRKELIEKADKKHTEDMIKSLTGNSAKRDHVRVILAITLILVFLIAIIAMCGVIMSKDRVIIERTTIRPVIAKETVTNNITNEYVIKGTKQMTCISKPNEKEIICYKEEKEDG